MYRTLLFVIVVGIVSQSASAGPLALGHKRGPHPVITNCANFAGDWVRVHSQLPDETFHLGQSGCEFIYEADEFLGINIGATTTISIADQHDFLQATWNAKRDVLRIVMGSIDTLPDLDPPMISSGTTSLQIRDGHLFISEEGGGSSVTSEWVKKGN